MNENQVTVTSDQPWFDSRSYAMLFRPIGQMLDRLRIDSFAVVADEDGFLVRDKTRCRAQVTPRERAFLAALQRNHANGIDKADALRLATGVLEWHVTPEDIERFEREGRAHRRAGDQTPDSHSISHVLRVIGSILDRRGAQIGSVLKDEQVVTLEYELPGGCAASERYDVPALYDFWVHMYMKRSGRSNDPRLAPQ
jgi:hypothetical protein